MEGRRMLISRSYFKDSDLFAFVQDGSITIKTTHQTSLPSPRDVETQTVHISEEALVAMVRNLGYIVEAVENKEV